MVNFCTVCGIQSSALCFAFYSDRLRQKGNTMFRMLSFRTTELRYYQIFITDMVKHKVWLRGTNMHAYTDHQSVLSQHSSPPSICTHACLYNNMDYIFAVDTRCHQGYDVYYLQLWRYVTVTYVEGCGRH